MLTTSPTVPELADHLRFSVTRTARRLRQQGDPALSPTLAAALSTIERAGPLGPSELARLERVQRPTITRVVTRLCDAGLVERLPDERDRRAALLEVTPAGRKALGTCAARRPPTWPTASPASSPTSGSCWPRRAAAGADAGGRGVTRLRRPFVPLRGPAYRRFFTGQAFARTSVWVQSVAELWLVLKLTGSGVSLGLTTALQFAPMLLFGAWAGLLADRLSKRRILLFAQAWMILPAAALFALTATGAVELWMVYLLVLARGFGHAVDNPVRQAFLSEVVEPGLIPASVSLNAALVSTARMAGPAIGGALIAGAGVVPCFAVATVGFVIALAGADRAAAARPGGVRARAARAGPAAPGPAPHPLRAGAADPARGDGRGGHAGLQLPGAAAADGAVRVPRRRGHLRRARRGDGHRRGGRLAAERRAQPQAGAGRPRPARPLLRRLHRPAGGRAHPAAGLRRAGRASGAASAAFAATTNALLQLGAAPAIRGRVMAMFSVVYLGSTPLGGPIVGWVAEHAGARAGFAVGAVATLLTGAAILFLARGQATAWLSSARARATTLSARWAGTSS